MPFAPNEERAAAILDRRAAGLLALDEALAELADAGCVATLATMISERIKVRAEAVSRALAADDDQPISVMCRAAGFKSNSYSALLRMRRRLKHGSGSAAQALALFSDLSRTSADRLLPQLVAELTGRELKRSSAR